LDFLPCITPDVPIMQRPHPIGHSLAVEDYGFFAAVKAV
jgi:hypothetical protein